MATFTHTISWRVIIDGRNTIYTFTYDIEDVINVQRESRDSGTSATYEFDTEPVLVAAVNKDGSNHMIVTLTETVGPTNSIGAYCAIEEMFVSHLSDSGGTWQEAASAVDNTLEALDQISVGSLASNGNSNFELIVLHQAAS